jgi:hypothetical protein
MAVSLCHASDIGKTNTGQTPAQATLIPWGWQAYNPARRQNSYRATIAGIWG